MIIIIELERGEGIGLTVTLHILENVVPRESGGRVSSQASRKEGRSNDMLPGLGGACLSVTNGKIFGYITMREWSLFFSIRSISV